MKVLFLAHSHVGLVKTGLYGQIHQTAAALRELGVGVELFSPWENQIESADICHFFSSSSDMWFYFSCAANFNVPCVWSPVFNVFDVSAFRVVFSARFGGRVPGVLSGWRLIRQMARQAARIFPLTRLEADRIRKMFPGSESKMRTIPNGIDRIFAQGDPDLFRRKHGLEDYVLNVAYIGPVKNQLNLIRAMKGLPMSLVLIGAPRLGEKEYLEACKREAGDNVIFAGSFPYADPMLLSAYAGAKVFALPSTTEVMTIALMEAGLAGCRLVASSQVPIVDYLQPYVRTPNPYSPRKIRKAILEAAADSDAPTAREVMLRQPTWPDVGRMILEEYEQVLKDNPRGA